jgi:crotonobetainyl-CoA:carnitine CoA-transferase CaiB-like acyl-CoA transferase
MFAAVGTLIALYEASGSGEGQLVDVSVQEAVAHALENAAQSYDLEHTVRMRVGAGQQDAGFGLFACRDGLVFLAVGVVGGAVDKAWIAMSEWLEGVSGGEVFAEPRWLDDPAFRRSDKGKTLFHDAFTAFASTRTKAELYAEGQARAIGICPVATTEDLANDEQLHARDFFVEVEHSDLGVSFLYPGAPYRLAGTPWAIRRRAPLLGEHTHEILAELEARQAAVG